MLSLAVLTKDKDLLLPLRVTFVANGPVVSEDDLLFLRTARMSIAKVRIFPSSVQHSLIAAPDAQSQ